MIFIPVIHSNRNNLIIIIINGRYWITPELAYTMYALLTDEVFHFFADLTSFFTLFEYNLHLIFSYTVIGFCIGFMHILLSTENN